MGQAVKTQTRPHNKIALSLYFLIFQKYFWVGLQDEL